MFAMVVTDEKMALLADGTNLTAIRCGLSDSVYAMTSLEVRPFLSLLTGMSGHIPVAV